MSIYEINTEILLYAYHPYKEQFDFAQETYDFSVLFLLQHGCFRCHVDNGAAQLIQPGAILFCPSGHTLYRETLSPITMHQICFRGVDFPDTLPAIPPRVQENLLHMSEYGMCFTPSLYPRLIHYCRDTLQVLYEQIKTPTDFDSLLAFLDQNFTQPITNSELCQRLHCSEVTLIACFRRAVGLTPQQYICHKRLDYAKQLLLTTSLTQKQIAGSSGFTDPLYFSRVFSRSIGMSPSDYRRRFKL